MRTKLYRPPVLRDFVARERLVAQLDSGLGLLLTLVSSPAGYGKSASDVPGSARRLYRVDLGPRLAKLMNRLDLDEEGLAYAGRILTAFARTSATPAPAGRHAPTGLIEAPSKRELEVLALFQEASIQVNPIFAAALEVQAFCESKDWRFCIIGALAVQRWGEPRLRRRPNRSLRFWFRGRSVTRKTSTPLSGTPTSGSKPASPEAGASRPRRHGLSMQHGWCSLAPDGRRARRRS